MLSEKDEKLAELLATNMPQMEACNKAGYKCNSRAHASALVKARKKKEKCFLLRKKHQMCSDASLHNCRAKLDKSSSDARPMLEEKRKNSDYLGHEVCGRHARRICVCVLIVGIVDRNLGRIVGALGSRSASACHRPL